jgi:hypothetical protein
MFVATSALQAFSLNVACGLRSLVLGWSDARLTMTLHFLDDLTQPLVLHSLGEQHCLQRLGFVRQNVAWDDQIRSFLAAFCG